MQIVLLSGGAGKRLWPLSNELYSKQFLRLLKRDDGSRESMIQRVCRQVCSARGVYNGCDGEGADFLDSPSAWFWREYLRRAVPA